MSEGAPDYSSQSVQPPLTARRDYCCGTGRLNGSRNQKPSRARARARAPARPPPPGTRPPLNRQRSAATSRRAPAPVTGEAEGAAKGLAETYPAPGISPGWSQHRAGPAAAQRRSKQSAGEAAAHPAAAITDSPSVIRLSSPGTAPSIG